MQRACMRLPIYIGEEAESAATSGECSRKRHSTFGGCLYSCTSYVGTKKTEDFDENEGNCVMELSLQKLLLLS